MLSFEHKCVTLFLIIVQLAVIPTKIKKMPLLVSTQEALTNALAGNVSVIYIDEELHVLLAQQIESIMTQHEYRRAEKEGKHGVCYLKHTGVNRFDAELHEIYDPSDIL